MPSRRLSRRTVLRGLGATVALPLLDVMPAAASGLGGGAPAAPASANRLAYLYFPNGFPRRVVSRGDRTRGRLLKLNEWMSPLEPFREHLVIPTNIWTPRGNGHVGGPPTWLTGGDYDRLAVNAGGVSADQVAARHLRDETMLPSLELSVQGEGFFSNSLPRNAISWSAPDRPMSREIEPRAVFDRMFRPPSGGATDRSVMDAVLADARALGSYVSAADRYRLDEYFESIRALERRIEFAERRSTEARDDGALTDTLTTPTPGIPDEHESYMRLMMDLMVAAFQSDATRVCTFMLDHGQSNRYFNFIEGVARHVARAVALQERLGQDRGRRRRHLVGLGGAEAGDVRRGHPLAPPPGRVPARAAAIGARTERRHPARQQRHRLRGDPRRRQ